MPLGRLWRGQHVVAVRKDSGKWILPDSIGVPDFWEYSVCLVELAQRIALPVRCTCYLYTTRRQKASPYCLQVSSKPFEVDIFFSASRDQKFGDETGSGFAPHAVEAGRLLLSTRFSTPLAPGRRVWRGDRFFGYSWFSRKEASRCDNNGRALRIGRSVH